MSDVNTNRPISIEAIARKLNAVVNFEQPEVYEEMSAEPRFREVLLFLQFVSLPENYAGGLRRFTADLIAQSLDLLGTAEMRAIGSRARWTAAEVRQVYAGFPDRGQSELVEIDDMLGFADFLPPPDECEDEDRDAAWFSLAEANRRERAARHRESEARIDALLAKGDPQPFQNVCRAAAEESLSGYLRNLCELPHARFTRGSQEDWRTPDQAPWYFCEVAAAVLRFIDRRKESLAAMIAETEITRAVFKWLGKARNTSRAVMISGNSRFGKTEALRTWCQMDPGQARLVNTPASNSEGDLLREVAKALGLEIGPHNRGSQLRDRIDYVLTHTRLMLVLDESHLLFPVNFSRNTAPARLNWIRRSVMDAGLPCAFCCTPQSYGSAKRRYVKTTGYAIEQFDERLLKTVELPDELSREDLLAVARIHFPKLDEDYLLYVVKMTSATERNYMSDLEKIATLARDNAQEAGRELPTFDDIEAAIADVLPPAPAAPIGAPAPVSARPAPARGDALPRHRKAPARPVQGLGNDRSSRSIEPSEEAFPRHTGRALFGSEIPEELTVEAGA